MPKLLIIFSNASAWGSVLGNPSNMILLSLLDAESSKNLPTT